MHYDALVRTFQYMFCLWATRVFDLKGPLDEHNPRVVSSSTSNDVPARDMSIGNEVSLSMISTLCTRWCRLNQ